MKKLDGSGFQINNNNYYFVNKSLNGDQIYPSVSGRYAGSHDAYYTFFNALSNAVQFKLSDINGSQVRIGREINKPLLYPNPANNIIYLNLSEIAINQALIRIYDMHGKEVLTQSINQTNFEIDISSLSSGVYFVNIISADDIITKKLIIN